MGEAIVFKMIVSVIEIVTLMLRNHLHSCSKLCDKAHPNYFSLLVIKAVCC